jgi:hypothetical protein
MENMTTKRKVESIEPGDVVIFRQRKMMLAGWTCYRIKNDKIHLFPKSNGMFVGTVSGRLKRKFIDDIKEGFVSKSKSLIWFKIVSGNEQYLVNHVGIEKKISLES